MKTILFLSLIFCTIARAEKTIAMDEVVSAFTWIKIAPEFPVVITAKSEDQVSFWIFDDEYTITRNHQNYSIVRVSRLYEQQEASEVVTLDSITIEKILKFVKSKKRSEAVLNSDIFQNSIKEKKIPSEFQASKTVYQCKSDLPSRITRDGSVVNRVLHHTWIQNGVNKSFGMPNTDESGYFGGRAHIRTPDSFIIKGPKHLECSPVWIPVASDEKKTSEQIGCVTRALSIPQNPIFEVGTIEQEWIAHFDYHTFKRNCLMAVRFALECAGARAAQVVNAGIGGKFKWTDLYSISEISTELKHSILDINNQLKKYRDQESISDLSTRSEELMNQALELDSKLRGVTGISTEKSLQEICQLALEKCSK